ncbi:SusC/RagA family TonB-linked outer membrane protein [Gillisia sp. Q332]|uniref:SusC/RagA family TonB-linked outer membrane protein n=1 Tax=Gillisia xinjiangensis TaxID=3384765 RepID=UPI0039191F61
MKITTNHIGFSPGKNKYLHIGVIIFSLFLFFGTAETQAFNSNENMQQIINGTVIDENGLPLPGVNVLVKGTNRGTQTDFDGNYSIDVSENETLVFSYIGYSNQEILIGGSTIINVTLLEDAAQLDEIVVMGYTTQTRGDLTGSVSSVDVSEATKQPIVNAAEALEGRVTGVTVVSNGQPGSSPVVRIRGFGTSNNNNPLYIIDGVQTDDPSILNSLNAADIAQMNVLKDGAAAIYGARASNGVIIITTKSGGYSMQKASISIDSYVGVSRAANLPDLLNPQQHGEMIFQSLRNDGATVQHPQYGDGASPVVPTKLLGIDVDATVQPGGTDWLDEIFQEALTHSTSISMQNGNENGKYLMSVNYLDREGIQLFTGYKRATTRLNSEFKLGDKFRLGEHLNASFDNTRSGNEINNALRSSPLIPVRDDAGNFAGTYQSSAGLSNPTNPVANRYRAADNYNKSLRLFGDVYASYQLFDELVLKTTFGGDIRSFNNRNFLPVNPEHSEARATNTLTESDFNRYEWVWTNTATYNQTFDNHVINAVVGIEALSTSQKGKSISRNDYLFENPDFYLLGNGAGTPNVNFAYDGTSTLFSIFGTANYSFAGKYLLTGTLRRDKSSRFLGENQSDIFPSVSAGWVISEEEFFPIGNISRLKLKASWGELGNQTLPASNPTINISNLNEGLANYAFNGSGAITTGAILSQVGNPNLRWEKSISKNVGLELGMFANALTASIEFYEIVTNDLITRDNSLISSTAIDAQAPLVNLGSIQNTGFDFNLGYQNSSSNDFTYGIELNLSRYDNEVTDLISDFQPGESFYRGGAITRSAVGRPLSSFYGRVLEGIFASEAEVSGHADQGFPDPASGVGRFKYSDINGDGVINDSDRTYIGSPHPDFTYGLNLMAGYKGFDISAFIAGSQGNDIYNYEKIYSDFPTFFDGNRSTRVLNSWAPDNTNAENPALSQTITNNETNPNSFFVEDGSYLRLKNLQVGYNFSENISDRLSVESLRLYVQGTNLFTITGYDGLDPEIQSFNSLNLGIDDNIYPISQILTLGVNIKL